MYSNLLAIFLLACLLYSSCHTRLASPRGISQHNIHCLAVFDSMGIIASSISRSIALSSKIGPGLP
uniref:Uncharacterized protein n=1 Tax=Utricularia reniformis TaxID=192314 RepID=A0A1Y0B468_9LAMI|nr:hypothetical protein AEK19_MT2054 [Utricularia reniformis]ART32211.1 hypothetical protein AEK19_MT2054 [Utricularia reniformis]